MSIMMTRMCVGLAILALLVEPAVPGTGAGDDVPRPLFRKDRLVVRFTDQAMRGMASFRRGPLPEQALEALRRRFGVSRITPLHAVHNRRARGARTGRAALANTYVLQLGAGIDPLAAAAAFRREHRHVVYAEPDLAVSVSVVAEDPYFVSAGSWGQPYDDLWALKGNRLDCATAWTTSMGDGVVVAVIDTGLDAAHEDMAANTWTNTDEVPGNGIDDDGNGYIDDTAGWDFVSGDNDPADGHGHGTHCAGTIAAVGYNGVGIIGVAPGARIMALKGLSDSGSGSSIDLAQAVTYAADNGADVLSCSWSGAGTSQALTDAFDYARAAGCVCLAAAGNDNADAAGYTPANIPGVIAVAASDAYDARASFSNYGEPISVAAPGVDILSLRAAGTSMGAPLTAHYTRANGTSMACPHAAGVAALVRAVYPGLDPDTVRSILESTADDIGTPGPDLYTGHGRVHAARAVQFDPAGLCVADISSPTPGRVPPAADTVTVTGSAYGDAFTYRVLSYTPAADPVPVTINASDMPVVNGPLGAWDVRGLPDGDYVLTLTVSNLAGDTFTDSVTVWIDNAAIAHPVEGQIVNNKDPLSVLGTAAGDGFVNYTIETAPESSSPAWSSDGITLAGGGLLPVIDDLLATFDPAIVPATGNILLRLDVHNADGSTQTDVRTITVDTLLAAGWPVQVETISDNLAYHKPYANLLDTGTGPRRLVVSSGSDVMTLSPQGALLNGWFQDANGVFYPLAVADLNGDGAEDMATNMRLGDNLTGVFDVYDAEGLPLPGWPVAVTLPGGGFYGLGSSPVAIGDVDGDGSPDIVANAFNTAGNLHLYAFRHTGSALPGWPVALPAADGANATLARMAPALADLDKDGTLNVVIGTFNNGLHVLTSDGTPRPGWPVAVPLKVVTSPAVGDLDADGNPDIVAGGTNGQVYAFGRDGSTLPGWPITVDRSKINDIALADLDGNGDLEVIFSAQYAMPGDTALWELLYVVHHDGSVADGWPQTLQPGYHASVPVVGDVDGDDAPDIVACYDWHGLAAFRANGELLWSRTIGDNFKGNTYPLLADLDADQRLELVAANSVGTLFAWDLDGVSAPWAAFAANRRFTGAAPAPTPPTPHAPVLDPVGPRQVDENALLTFTVTATDVDGDPLRFSAENLPTGAVFTDDADADGTADGFGTFTWTPGFDQAGVYEVTFHVSDGALADTERVAITVSDVNRPPVAGDQSVATSQDIPVTVTLTAQDPDGDPLAYSIAQPPSHGTLSGTPPEVTYTPSPAFTGTDSFGFTATDGRDTSNIGTVQVTVLPAANQPPVSADDTYTLDKKVNNISAPGILANDTDGDGDSLAAVLLTDVTAGTLTLRADGSFKYMPRDRGVPDSFSYRAWDGKDFGNVAVVHINGTAVNRPPVAYDQNLSANVNTPQSLTLQADDPDGDALAFRIVDPPAHGTLSGTAPAVVYTPDTDYQGADAFTFAANDGELDSNIATVNISVSAPGENHPPVAADDRFEGLTKNVNTVPSPGVLANDTDADGDSLRVILVTGTSHGSLDLRADGSFQYRPDIRGMPDRFTYKVTDGTDESNVATVDIN